MDIALKAAAAIIKKFPAVVLVFIALSLKAQETPFLERPVTIAASNLPIAEIFKTISQQTGVVFSYNSQQFDDKQKTTLVVNKKPLRTVLNILLKPTACGYTLKKKYIIIKCGQKKSQQKSTFIISGYMVSAQDSAKITNGSVFIKSTRQSSITDSFGFFKLAVQPAGGPLYISFAKENYIDSTVTLANASDNELWVYLRPVVQQAANPVSPQSVVPVQDSVKKNDTVAFDTIENKDTLPTSKFWERQKKLNANLRNIRDTLFSKVSFSLIPSVSTNKLLSFNTVNNFSFNVLVGKSKGANGLEVGGLLNYDFGNVKYVQLAGWGNVVAGNVKYVQVGGLFNSTLGDIEGVQAGGIFNTANAVNGVQVGGIFNIVKRDVKGVQIGGIFNTANSINGVQIAGIFNDVPDSVKELQLAGVLNRAGDMQGLQLAGAVNLAQKINGMQLSGAINYAKVVNGVQLSPFNFSDSCNGVPIGIFSYVKKGYHKIEIAFDELQITSIAFRSGVDKFHNVFFAGFNSFQSQKFWTYGYGLGHYRKITPRKGFLFDISAQQLQNINAGGTIKLNLLNRLAITYSYSVAKKFSVALGPSVNFFTQSVVDNSFANTFNIIAPHAFYSDTFSGIKNHAWIGGKISLKIL